MWFLFCVRPTNVGLVHICCGVPTHVSLTVGSIINDHKHIIYRGCVSTWNLPQWNSSASTRFLSFHRTNTFPSPSLLLFKNSTCVWFHFHHHHHVQFWTQHHHWACWLCPRRCPSSISLHPSSHCTLLFSECLSFSAKKTRKNKRHYMCCFLHEFVNACPDFSFLLLLLIIMQTYPNPLQDNPSYSVVKYVAYCVLKLKCLNWFFLVLVLLCCDFAHWCGNSIWWWFWLVYASPGSMLWMWKILLRIRHVVAVFVVVVLSSIIVFGVLELLI